MTRTLRAALCLLLVALSFRLTVAGMVALDDLQHPSSPATIPAVHLPDVRDPITLGRPLTVRA